MNLYHFDQRPYRVPASFLLILIIALLVSGCTSSSIGGKVSASHPPAARSMPVQPISGSQLLSGGPITYVALGASDAVGVGSSQPGAQGYVPLLAERLPKDSHLINLGVSGIHLNDALVQEVPIALSTSPKLITIWLVANDFVAGVTYENYMKYLDTLLKQLRMGTTARIVMANLPDLTRLPFFAHLTSAQKDKMYGEIQRWNAGIAKTASRYDVAVVDLLKEESQLTAHPEYVSADGFHPSPAGYVQLANYFWEAIKGNS